jgi:hypothetical protein
MGYRDRINCKNTARAITTLILYLLTSICFADYNTGPVDHVEISKKDNLVILTLHMDRPVMILYHTPKESGRNLIIGIRDIMFYRPSDNASSRQIVSFNRKLTTLVDYIEYTHEAGFSPYLLINFTEDVHFTVLPARNARQITITIDTLKKNQ